VKGRFFMNHHPLITTIIPTYRRPHLLKRAIKSVLNQSFEDFQLCIYDNASGDETKSTVEFFAKKDSRVKYFCHDTNIGALKNSEFGLKRVDTPYFSFLSDDDLLFPDFYQVAIKELVKYSEVAFFAGNCLTLNSKNQILYKGFIKNEEGLYCAEETVKNHLINNFVPWTSIIFNTKIVSSFKLESSFKISDIDYVTNIMYNHPIYISSKLCAVFTSNPSSLSGNFKIDDMLPFVDIILPKLDLYKNMDVEIHRQASARIRDYVKQFICLKAFEQIKLRNSDELSRIKTILRERFKAYDFLKKLDFYEKIRKWSFIWYPLLFIRRSIQKSYKFFIGNVYFYKDKKSVIKLLKSL
jgi:glycosyltransferase involved in cell wall biosynthesis